MAKEVTVLIGVAWNGKPIAGVVNQPFFEKNTTDESSFVGRVLWGIVGLGAFDLTRGQITVPKSTSDKLRIVTTRSHIDGLIKRDLSAIPNCELSHAGGAGYKVLNVIDGKSDYYLYPKDGTKRWDTCAPEALIRSLNGTMTDIFGREYSYKVDENDFVQNCYGIVFGLEKNNDKVIQHLSDELKNTVLAEVEKLKAKKNQQ